MPKVLEKADAEFQGTVLVSNTLNYLQKVTTISGAASEQTLTASDSGTLFLVDASTGAQTFTLPALKSGFNIKIIVTVLSDNDVIITAPGDNMIFSGANFTASSAAGSHLTDTCTTVRMNADTVNAVVGSRVEIYCDGTNYVAIGESSTASDTAFWARS